MNSSTQHPNLPEPTPQEIAQTNAALEEAYNIVLPESDALHLVKLIKELEWWNKADAKDGFNLSADRLAFALEELVRGLNGSLVNHEEAHEDAEVMLSVIPFREKQRLTNEIKAILVEHRPIPYEPAVAEKFSEFLQKNYSVTLTEDQLGQAIQYVSRKLWFEEGLNSSLETCLDELLIAPDKGHKAVRQAFDWVASKLHHQSF